MNKRAAPRNRVLKAGTIEFGDSAITCIVRNMSDTGALLDVATPVGIPDHFTLVPSEQTPHALPAGGATKLSRGQKVPLT
jgi:hypothetical protein